jgi:hypothetical protein
VRASNANIQSTHCKTMARAVGEDDKLWPALRTPMDIRKLDIDDGSGTPTLVLVWMVVGRAGADGRRMRVWQAVAGLAGSCRYGRITHVDPAGFA